MFVSRADSGDDAMIQWPSPVDLLVSLGTQDLILDVQRVRPSRCDVETLPCMDLPSHVVNQSPYS